MERFSNNHNPKFVANTQVTLSFFYRQPVYKQLAIGGQIAKQLSGLNSLSLSNNKDYRLKKNQSFPFGIDVN